MDALRLSTLQHIHYLGFTPVVEATAAELPVTPVAVTLYSYQVLVSRPVWVNVVEVAVPADPQFPNPAVALVVLDRTCMT